MSQEALIKLSEKRTAHYKSIKENHDQSHKIIGEQLYSTQSHFIFELLQNAEDELATNVSISYNQNVLIFEHNGRPFDIADVEAITSFGHNERKKLKTNAIGRFGIGFKSVFSVTDKPEIKSGSFHFSISNYIVPTLISFEKSNQTKITLPFKKFQNSDIYAKIESALNSINSNYLLFLNNIRSIEVINLISAKKKELLVERKNYKKSNFKLLSIIDDGLKEFLLFEKNVAVGNKKLPVKIAFTISKKSNRIIFVPVNSSPLFAFFATEKDTNLPFYIHAPFLTTPARDNIVSDDKRNSKLFEGLNQLMLSAIDELKGQKLISLKTWLVFPCNIAFYKNEIYKEFCDSFFRYLLNRKHSILPTDGDNFCNVYSAIKVRQEELKTLISRNETMKLFGRSDWITSDIDKSEFEIVKAWIERQFKVPTIGYKELIEKADNDFFSNKTDDWLLKFYRLIGDNAELWRAGSKTVPMGPLRSKSFIRTSKNKTINPFDENGNLNVYLPTEGNSNYQFVKDVFLSDKDAKKLFKSLNITKPDLIAEVNEHVIPRIKKVNTYYRGFKEDVLKIFKAISKAEPQEERLLINKLKDISWLPVKSNMSRSITFKKPFEVYYPTRDLKALLKTSSTALFLDTTVFNKKDNKPLSKEIFEEMGVFFRPKRFYIQGENLYFENPKNSLNDWNNPNIHLDGITEFVSQSVDRKASLMLWNIMLKAHSKWMPGGFYKTKFIEELKAAKWLFNKYGQRFSPTQMIYSDLDEFYENSKKLEEALKFKANEIKNIEIEYDGKFLSNDELKKFNDQLAELKKENERLKNMYEPVLKDEDEINLPNLDSLKFGEALSIIEREVGFTDIPINNQIDMPTSDGWSNVEPVYINTVPTNRQKSIGSRGEAFVIKLLNKKYANDKGIKISDLNEQSKLGVGCDIIVKKDDAAISLIEVKTSEGGFESKFKISEKQWKTALRSHLDKNEPLYIIYCIYYAASANPQYLVINDPIGWMLQNKLRFTEQWFTIKNIKNP